MTAELRDVAGSIARQIASLLRAQVCVLDDHGEVVGSSPARVGVPTGADQLHVPIHLHSRAGEVVISAACETASPHVIQAVVEMTVNQVLTTAQLQHQHTLKATFVHDLLHGQLQDEVNILRQGQILGMDLSRPRAVILIEAADHIIPATARQYVLRREVFIRRRVQEIIDAVVSFFELPSDAICAHIGEGEVVVLKASSTRDLAAWAGPDGQSHPAASWADLDALKRAAAALLARLRADTGKTISVGIGRYHPGVLGLARSYEDARAALSLGCRFQGRNRVHCLDSLGIAAFVGVSHELTKLSLANHLLSPLDHEPELIDTLQTFFDLDCCLSRVAQALSIHRNTLSYRLDKVASLTGLDPRRFDQVVQIRLALLVQALHDVRPDSASLLPLDSAPTSLPHRGVAPTPLLSVLNGDGGDTPALSRDCEEPLRGALGGPAQRVTMLRRRSADGSSG
jgi:carbohydrate diacid regulator